jgi:hypothetical protein
MKKMENKNTRVSAFASARLKFPNKTEMAIITSHTFSSVP